jgi:hypothetical protein
MPQLPSPAASSPGQQPQAALLQLVRVLAVAAARAAFAAITRGEAGQ